MYQAHLNKLARQWSQLWGTDCKSLIWGCHVACICYCLGIYLNSEGTNLCRKSCRGGPEFWLAWKRCRALCMGILHEPDGVKLDRLLLLKRLPPPMRWKLVKKQVWLKLGIWRCVACRITLEFYMVVPVYRMVWSALVTLATTEQQQFGRIKRDILPAAKTRVERGNLSLVKSQVNWGWDDGFVLCVCDIDWLVFGERSSCC